MLDRLRRGSDALAPWEGKTISGIIGNGFVHEPQLKTLELTGLKLGQALTRRNRDVAIKELMKTGKFDDIQTVVQLDPKDIGKVIVTICVVERVKANKD